MLCIYKTITSFGDTFFPDLTCKIVQDTKQVSMYDDSEYSAGRRAVVDV